MAQIIAILRFFAFFLLCLVVVPTQTLLLLFHRGRGSYWIPHLWHKAVCLIFGIKVIKKGKIETDRQTIYVSNHISYLDIPAIASILREASFVAKKDVASWPVFGYLSKLQQTAFISRSASDAKKEKHNLEVMLDDGKSLIIFPEGTSTDGVSVKNFKSSLFEIAMQRKDQGIVVQPFTIKVLETNGKSPENQDERDIYAWHLGTDIELHEHLWNFAKNGTTVLEVTFHKPLTVSEFENRKALSNICHETVLNGLEISKAA